METPTYSTAETIIEQARAETGVGANPKTTAAQDAAMLRRLHDANEEFVNYPYSVGIMGWQFLVSETIISSKASTTLNGALSSGDTSIVLTSGTNFDDPGGTDIGAGYVKTSRSSFDIFSYLDKSSNTLSSVSGIQLAHTTGSEVHKLYQLPSTFGKIRNVFYEGVNEYTLIDDNIRQIPWPGYYSLVSLTNTTYSATFMILPEDIGAHEFKVYFVRKAGTIDESSDTVDAPNGAGRRFLVERMKQYIWDVIGETQDSEMAEARAQRALNEAAEKWTTHHVQPNQSLSLYW